MTAHLNVRIKKIKKNKNNGQSIVSSLHIHFKKQTPDELVVYVAWFNDQTLKCFSDGKSINIKSLATESYRQ